MKTFLRNSAAIAMALLLAILFLPAVGLEALPGYTRGQLGVLAKQYGWGRPAYGRIYYKDELKIDQGFSRGRVVVTELSKKGVRWEPGNGTAHDLIVGSHGEELAADFKAARLVYDGVHVGADNRLNLFMYQRLPLNTTRAELGHRMKELEAVMMYAGKKYTYEYVHDKDNEKFLRIRSARDAVTTLKILKENKELYETWRKTWPVRTDETRPGEIQYDVLDEVAEDDLKRDMYFYYVPRSLAPGQSTGIMLINHGDGGGGRHTIKPWLKLAEKYRLILGAPIYNANGFDTDLDVLVKIPTVFKKLRARFKNQYKLHAGAILIGFSAGGAHSHIVAEDNPELIRAYSTNSSSAIGGFEEFRPQAKLKDKPVLITCGMKRGYNCGNSAEFVRLAKRMGFRSATYAPARSFRQAYAAIDRFLGSLGP